MNLVDDPDESFDCPPGACRGCGTDLAGEPVPARRPGPCRTRGARPAGGQSSSSGSSTRFIVDPGSPGCFPAAVSPRSRSDRSLALLLIRAIGRRGPRRERGRVTAGLALKVFHPGPTGARPAQSAAPPARSARRSARYASASRAASSQAGRTESSSTEGTPDTPATTGNHRHSAPLVEQPAPACRHLTAASAPTRNAAASQPAKSAPTPNAKPLTLAE